MRGAQVRCWQESHEIWLARRQPQIWIGSLRKCDEYTQHLLTSRQVGPWLGAELPSRMLGAHVALLNEDMGDTTV